MNANATEAASASLPPAIVRPLERPWRPLRSRWAALAMREAGDEPVMLVVVSRTRVDTGLWFRRRRLLVVCLRREVLLLAPGRRPFVRRFAREQLRESLYNHVTGRLLPGPAGDDVPAIRLAPLDAYQVLAQIHHEVNEHV